MKNISNLPIDLTTSQIRIVRTDQQKTQTLSFTKIQQIHQKLIGLNNYGKQRLGQLQTQRYTSSMNQSCQQVNYLPKRPSILGKHKKRASMSGSVSGQGTKSEVYGQNKMWHQQSCEALIENINRLNIQNKELQKTIIDKQLTIKILNSNNQQLNEQNQKLKSKIENLTSKSAQITKLKDQQYNNLKKLNDDLKRRQIEQIEQKNSSQLMRLNKQLLEKETTISGLLSEVNLLKLQINKQINYNQEINKLNKTISELIVKNKELTLKAGIKNQVVGHLWGIKQIQYSHIVNLIGKANQITK